MSRIVDELSSPESIPDTTVSTVPVNCIFGTASSQVHNPTVSYSTEANQRLTLNQLELDLQAAEYDHDYLAANRSGGYLI
jgi:hypothetical protein